MDDGHVTDFLNWPMWRLLISNKNKIIYSLFGIIVYVKRLIYNTHFNGKKQTFLSLSTRYVINLLLWHVHKLMQFYTVYLAYSRNGKISEQVNGVPQTILVVSLGLTNARPSM